MSACIFCKIAAGEMQTRAVYEDDELFAFKDLNPQAPVHILLIPKKHISGLAAAKAEDEALLGRLMLAAAKIAAENGLDNGFRVVTNNGRGAGQSVEHLHFHIMGGRRMGWPPG